MALTMNWASLWTKGTFIETIIRELDVCVRSPTGYGLTCSNSTPVSSSAMPSTYSFVNDPFASLKASFSGEMISKPRSWSGRVY
ncbi:hypothetical protein IAQ61_010602 [Plenodomus lingam]|uniref:uncharacterized protein n=1 Tax=Leptosphaeria maculans TaxID=5022 RepID=UPI003318F55B|nr:hypothetical protein IAQ61_010602 [Plenodomus lingam]